VMREGKMKNWYLKNVSLFQGRPCCVIIVLFSSATAAACFDDLYARHFDQFLLILVCARSPPHICPLALPVLYATSTTTKHAPSSRGNAQSNANLSQKSILYCSDCNNHIAGSTKITQTHTNH
jgi:hypothetical protein